MAKKDALRAVDLPFNLQSGSVTISGVSGGGSVVTDHGGLGGLTDDDHTRYHNDARGDVRYYTQSYIDALDVHTRLHSLTDSSDHSVPSGAANLDVLGIASSAVSMLTPRSDVRTTNQNSVLRDAAGVLGVAQVQTPLITAGGDLTLMPVGEILGTRPALFSDTVTVTGNLTATADIIAGGLQWDSSVGQLWINSGSPDGSVSLHVRSLSADDVGMRLQQIASQSADMLQINDNSGAPLIILDNAGNLESGNPGFVSGLAGWRIGQHPRTSRYGYAEFNDIFVRGELSATVFNANEYTSTDGTIWIPPGGTVLLENDSSVPDAGGSVSLDFRDPKIGHLRKAVIGDLLMTKTMAGLPSSTVSNNLTYDSWQLTSTENNEGLHIQEYWFEVTAISDEGSYYRYTCDVKYGNASKIYAGTPIINMGQYRNADDYDGGLMLTADQPASPFISVFSLKSSTPWIHGYREHVRVGRIGISGEFFDYGSPLWGMKNGSNLSDPLAAYTQVDQHGVHHYKNKSTYSDGINTTGLIEASGSFQFAADINDPDKPGFRFESSTGNVTIGRYPDGQYIRWNQDTGTMTISEEITIPSPDAQVDWDAILNKPDQIGDAGVNSPQNPAVAGLYLNGSYFGYWDGSAWRTYLDNLGRLQMVGSSGNKIRWDGDQLQGLNGSTVQWYADSADGALRAGGGAVELNADGLTILSGSGSSASLSRSINWGDANRRIYGYSYTYGAYQDHGVEVVVANATTRNLLTLAALPVDSAYDVKVELISEPTRGTLNLQSETVNIELNGSAGSRSLGITGLPTTNPGGYGNVWNDGGTLKIT